MKGLNCTLYYLFNGFLSSTTLVIMMIDHIYGGRTKLAPNKMSQLIYIYL
jgi:hypothetical protein